MVNVLLVFYFLKPTSVKDSTTSALAWQLQSYPEINSIKGSDWDFQKLTAFFQDLALKKGGEYAYHALAVAANMGYLPPNIDTHLLGHVVGDELYKQQGINGIKVCTEDLRDACAHSIVVGYLLDHGASGLPVAVAACHGAPGGLGAYTMCVHGLGHGVLAYTEYNMQDAVKLCETTGTPAYGNQEVGQCVGGVTMEMMAGVHDHDTWLKESPNYFKANDPLSPCDMGFIPKGALSYCYVYLTPHLFAAAGADLSAPDPKYFGKAMSFCSALPKNDSNRDVCFGSFGKEYVVLANARNVESVVNMNDDQLKLIYNWCRSGPDEALSPCLDSALQSLYWGGENDPGVSIRFCSVIPDKTQSDKCMHDLIGAVSYYMPNNDAYKQSFCKEIPEEYQDSCRLQLSVQNK